MKQITPEQIELIRNCRGSLRKNGSTEIMSNDFNFPNQEHFAKLWDKLVKDFSEKKCEHKFDGKVWYSEDGRTGSVTCSLCGLPEIYYDIRRLT